jgi:hypothetical protein
MRQATFEKIGFVISLMVLSFLYGFAARWHGWFPNTVLEQASQKITALSSTWSPESALLRARVYDREGVQIKDAQQIQPGLTVVTSSWTGEGGLKPEIRLLDKRGNVVHARRIDRGSLFPDSALGLRGGDPNRRILNGSYLLPNGDVLVNLEYIGTARLDACGRVQWTSVEGNHHSIAQAADGSFWIPGTSQRLRTSTPAHPDGIPGFDDPVYLDWILHISEQGELLDKINVIDLLYANGLERYISKVNQPQAGTGGPRKNDITHMNDVEPLPPSLAAEYPLFESGDLLMSLRNLHLILVVDPKSKEVKWHASAPFIQQHDADFVGDGWIGVFDNNEDFTKRGTMLGGSRIVTLQPHTDSMAVRFPTPRSESLYTDVWGKWQQLDNGNMLLTESSAGRVAEVTPNGRTVWEWVHAPYEESNVPAVTKAARHDLTREDIATWPCSSVDSTQGEKRE